MPSLPSAAALAVLVVMAGVAGVVAADTSDATPTATATAVEATPNVNEPMPPDTDGSFEERLAHRLSQFNLTDEQIRSIVNEAVRLRDDGASRLVIRSSIVMNLYEYGVDAPFLYAGDAGPPSERIAEYLGERFDLTDRQVAEIAATIDRLHADGASRAEIYRAVHALLVEYGVDDDEIDDLRKRLAHAKAHRLDERARSLHQQAHRVQHFAADGDAVDRHVDRLESRYDLTDEQAEELERLIRGMLADGEPREAIVEAVREQLDAWGVDPATEQDSRGDG